MKRGQQPHGYTIVEVLIFMVITGVLLASALLVFRGQQQRTQFTQGVRETESRLRTVINEVSSGYYPNNNTFRCYVSGGSIAIDGASPNQQGANTGCVFLGKAVRFSQGSDYKVYTVVGLQRSDGQEVTNIASADPTAIARFEGDALTVPDITENFSMPWGVAATRVYFEKDGVKTDIGGLGLILSLGSYTQDEDNQLVSGSQTASLLPLTETTLGSSDAIFKAQGIENMQEADRSAADRIVICLSSGGSDRKAAIIIGGSGRQLSTETQIDNVPDGC